VRAGRGRAVLRGAAALAAVALLAACTSGDDGDDPADGGPVEPIDQATMRLAIGGPLVVDPAEASVASPSDLMVLDLLHDGLTRLDDAGVPRPALAASWSNNDTLTAFRFELAPDVTFSSGRPITPQDVIASLERVMAAGDSSLAALSLEAIEGFRAFADGEAEHVSGLTAPGPSTVRIGLTTPLSVLPVVLSSPVLSVVDEASITGGLADLDLTGAWSVASSEDGDLALDPRGAAMGLQHVELRGYDDLEAAYEAFEDGNIDWAEVPPSRFEEAVDEHGDSAFAPFHAELFFGMNVSTPALASQPLRQAIALAIDHEAIVEAVYADVADPLTTVVPAGIPGHDPNRCSPCPPDPTEAESIVAFAFPDGNVPVVRIDYDESPAQDAMAEMVAEDLEDVGIPTELRALPLEEYESFVVSGGQELFSFGWIGAYRSPDAYLAPLFGASANDNLTNYRSNQVDDLLEGARASTDAARNTERWALAERQILTARVVVPIAQFRTQPVVASRVQGLQHAVDGTVDWTKVSLGG
jgi:ABC-type transport system substrate-binding protein